MTKTETSNEAAPVAVDESAITSQMRKVMNYTTDNGRAAKPGLTELLGIRHTRVHNLMREMKESELLRIDGGGKNKSHLPEYGICPFYGTAAAIQSVHDSG